MPQLQIIAHVSKRGSSFVITVPKNVAGELKLKEKDMVGFYEENGRYYIKKME